MNTSFNLSDEEAEMEYPTPMDLNRLRLDLRHLQSVQRKFRGQIQIDLVTTALTAHIGRKLTAEQFLRAHLYSSERTKYKPLKFHGLIISIGRRNKSTKAKKQRLKIILFRTGRIILAGVRSNPMRCVRLANNALHNMFGVFFANTQNWRTTNITGVTKYQRVRDGFRLLDIYEFLQDDPNFVASYEPELEIGLRIRRRDSPQSKISLQMHQTTECLMTGSRSLREFTDTVILLYLSVRFVMEK